MKKVLHNSYTMCSRSSPDIHTLSPWALGVYIRQTTRALGIATYACSCMVQREALHGAMLTLYAM